MQQSQCRSTKAKSKNKTNISLIVLSGCLFIIVVLSCIIYFQHKGYEEDKEKWKQASVIIISKQEMNLRVIDFKGKELLKVPVATGLAYGNKKKRGDNRTPEGVFKVVDIQDASGWTHDFGDGKGAIDGCYGSHFIRLETPGHSGIGIHGTHLPESIGKRASEGCIRLKNEDLLRLVPLVSVPMTVIITPASEDLKAN